METLDFPTIDAAAPVPRTEIATAAAGALDLTKIDLTDVALSAFDEAQASATKAKETLTGVVHDLNTPTKLADAKSLRNRLINLPLADARKVSKNLKSKLTAVSAAVGTKLATIEAEFEAAGQLITPQIEAAEAQLAEEKRIRDEKEATRKQAHQDQLAVLASYADKAVGLPSERIANGIKMVEGIEIDRAAWEEFADRAVEQRAVTLERMRKLHAEALAAEQLEAQRLENERIAAEQKAEADRLAAERAAFEAEKTALRAQQAAAQREAEEAAMRVRDEQARVERDAALNRQAAQEAATSAPASNPATARVCEVSAPASPPAAAPMQATPAARVIHPASQALRSEPPTLKLGVIGERLGFALTADFLAALGFSPAATDRGAKLFHERQFDDICMALVRHIKAVQADMAVAA